MLVTTHPSDTSDTAGDRNPKAVEPTDFGTALLRKFVASRGSDHRDNRNTYTSDHRDRLSIASQVRDWLARLTGRKRRRGERKLRKAMARLDPYLDRLSALHARLEDVESRRRLVEVVAFRLLGPRQYKLPLNNEAYWQSFRELEAARDESDRLPGLGRWKLARQHVRTESGLLELYNVPVALLNVFVLRQYECPGRPDLAAGKDDVVIDAGGCWGDTALYFAGRVGRGGAVHVFEFVPRNLDVLRRNLALNPDLEPCVHVVERPLWSESDVPLHLVDEGPASRVDFEPMPGSQETLTMRIDDYVEQQGLARVDFVKMDIEGAELPALEGARGVIERFRPTLAISSYHSLDDLVGIPELIDSMNLGYRFYLGHYTINAEETVLFATVD